MPRTFTLSARYRASVEQLFAAFADERYWLTRLGDSGADTATLDSITVDAAGVDVVTTQSIRRDRLPALAAQFHPGDLEVVRSERWRTVPDGGAQAEIAGRILRAPAQLTGTAVLAPAEPGAALGVTATVQVDIPLVGGKIENFIGTQLAELITAEQRFTTQWLLGIGGEPTTG